MSFWLGLALGLALGLVVGGVAGWAFAIWTCALSYADPWTGEEKVRELAEIAKEARARKLRKIAREARSA